MDNNTHSFSSTVPVKPDFPAVYELFIDGAWTPGESGKTLALKNPSTDETLSRVAAATPADVKRAVDAASRAFPAWARTSSSHRSELLHEIARRLKSRAAHYAMAETLNNGKTINESLYFDLPAAIEQFSLFAGSPWQLHGETRSTPTTIGIVHREPLGVIAQIIPWNAALVMMAAKIAPALAAGNTVVLKPSEIVCLSVMEFVRDIADVLPPGVLNVVTGYGPDIGEALVTDSRVRKVSFTGSRPTARALMKFASVNIIPQTMELGGKSANIVCEDADLAAAAEGAVMSTVCNKGEICFAGSRLFVHRKIRDKFLDILVPMLQSVSVGDPLSPATFLGAQASQMQMDKILSYLDIGRGEGASVLTGGGRASVSGLPEGLFMQPTLFVDVDNSMRIAQEEIFGPVTSLITFDDEDEVIRLANDTVYGLGAGLWTQDLARAHRMACALETGTVWVNQYYNFIGGMSTGGYKQSGFGREMGYEVLNHYTQTKNVVINLRAGPIGIFGPHHN